jgi:hypothetical protein
VGKIKQNLLGGLMRTGDWRVDKVSESVIINFRPIKILKSEDKRTREAVFV